MTKLTDEAKAYAIAYYEAMDSEALRNILEGELGMACYDDEEQEDWALAAVDSVEAGDLGVEIFRMDVAKSCGHHVYSKWLDYNDIWEE